MKKTIPCIFHFAIGTGLVVGNWYGIREVGNIVFVVIWILVILNFLVVLFIGKGDIENNDQSKIVKYVNRTFLTVNIVILFAAGWFVTGSVLLLTVSTVWIKK